MCSTDLVIKDCPPQIKRADLFEYIEKELNEIETDMYDPGMAPYGRADKAANWLLRSRLLLNAEVYANTPRWNDAATYAKKVMDSQYQLSDSYSHLFMADNDGSSVNKAPNEIILPIGADGVMTQSWASSLFIIASTHTSDMPNWGTTEGWGGNRARKSLVEKFFDNGMIPFWADMNDLSNLGDDRALVFAADRPVEIAKTSVFKQGLSVTKFSNLRADGGLSKDSKFTDMDIPFMRKAEAYLTYAEATLRAGGSQDEALKAVNELRARANTKLFTSIDLNKGLDEKSREFFFEGHRRTDLIRYGYFGGSTDYRWDWKGGSASGTSFD